MSATLTQSPPLQERIARLKRLSQEMAAARAEAEARKRRLDEMEADLSAQVEARLGQLVGLEIPIGALGVNRNSPTSLQLHVAGRVRSYVAVVSPDGAVSVVLAGRKLAGIEAVLEDAVEWLESLIDEELPF